jgi:hypothetical protein
MKILFNVDANDVLHHSVRSGPLKLLEDGNGKMEQDSECSQYRSIRNPLNHISSLETDQKARIRPIYKPFVLLSFAWREEDRNPKKQAFVQNVWAPITWDWAWASLADSVRSKALGVPYCR